MRDLAAVLDEHLSADFERLDTDALPVTGAEQADKLLDPTERPTNELIPGW